jgi:hypothetical protein
MNCSTMPSANMSNADLETLPLKHLSVGVTLGVTFISMACGVNSVPAASTNFPRVPITDFGDWALIACHPP